jgi:hypothetical protein
MASGCRPPADRSTGPTLSPTDSPEANRTQHRAAGRGGTNRFPSDNGARNAPDRRPGCYASFDFRSRHFPPYEDGLRPRSPGGDTDSACLQVVRAEIAGNRKGGIRTGFRADQPLTRHAQDAKPATQPAGSTSGECSSDPAFKTGRAGQPPAWKVRFLRRVAQGFSWYSVESGLAASREGEAPPRVNTGQFRPRHSPRHSPQYSHERGLGGAVEEARPRRQLRGRRDTLPVIPYSTCAAR